MPGHESFGRCYSGRNASLGVSDAISCIPFDIRNAVFGPEHRHGSSVAKRFAGARSDATRGGGGSVCAGGSCPESSASYFRRNCQGSGRRPAPPGPPARWRRGISGNRSPGADGVEIADDRASLYVQGCEQRGEPATGGVAGSPFGLARLHRQEWLGAAQGLDLALLVRAERQRMIRRVAVQPHDYDSGH